MLRSGLSIFILKSSLGIAMIGLIAVTTIGIIFLVLKGNRKRIEKGAATLKSADRLGLQIQLSMTAVSGLFSMLALLLGRLFE